MNTIILGAGPAGSVAALILARAGAPVTLVDRDDEGFRIGEGLPPAGRPLLTSLGLMERFAAQGHLPSYGNRSAWGSALPTDTDFILHPHGHGWHLDRRAFDRGLAEAARGAGAVWRVGRVVAFDGSPGAWTLRMEDGSELRGEVVIDCSGRGSRFARARGARREGVDRLVATAVVGTGGPVADHDTVTWVESAADGWWYTARIPGGRRVFVYLSDDGLPTGTEPRGQRFEALLETTRYIREFRAGYSLDVPRTMPAESACLSHFSGPGWLAAGDAAASFDPVSSQGIVTAMTFGRRAAEAVLDGDFAAYDEAVRAVYARYLRERADCYALERRFDTPFWDKRRQT